MTTDLPPFDDGHGREVLFLPGPIREPGVTPGHLDRAVSQKLLNTLQPHAGVEQFRLRKYDAGSAGCILYARAPPSQVAF